MTRRVGLLGGRFDPPHAGHLRLAELALEALDLDELRLVPTAVSPHKAPEDGASGEARLRLLEAFLGAAGEGLRRRFRIEPCELRRGGTSYTVDTLEALAAREPGSAWVLVLGGDQMAAFPTWRRAARILELASLAVAPRPGFPEEDMPPELAARLRNRWSGAPGEVLRLPSTGLDAASRHLRVAMARGETPQGLDPQVRAAIEREKLYRRYMEQEHE